MRVSKTNAERQQAYDKRMLLNKQMANTVHRKFAWWPTWTRDTGAKVWLEYVWRYADLYDCVGGHGELMWFCNFTTREAAQSSLDFAKRYR